MMKHSVKPALGIILITPLYNYSSLLIRDLDDTFTVFSRFIMKYSSLAIRDLSRRASLSVRITDKNGDHAEAGKIWENQFFTRKMGLHGPKNTQIHKSTCQGPRGACPNFFSFTI